MIESVVSALLLATISAVVLVAYRHPGAFAKLHSTAKRTLGILGLCSLAFALGDNNIRGDVRALLGKTYAGEEDFRSALRFVVDKEPPFLWILIGIAAIAAFLEALAALPRIGISGQPSPDPEQAPSPQRLQAPTVPAERHPEEEYP